MSSIGAARLLLGIVELPGYYIFFGTYFYNFPINERKSMLKL